MIDAGSTGSRIHIYKFNYCSESPTLVNEVFKQTQPGLSSYQDDPKAAAQSLDVLMNIAMKEVPKRLRKCTPVAVKATAGLRLLGEEKSNAILNEVEKRLKAMYPFTVVKDKGVVVMDGKDEGVFAWITVNYLLKSIGVNSRQSTAAIMDLGGGSTQIVFEPTPEIHLLPGDHRYEVTFGGEKYALYQHSYLGHGLMEARETVFKSGPEQCLAKGITQEWKKIILKGLGSDFHKCAAITNSALFNKSVACAVSPCSFDGVYQPSMTDTFHGHTIYAFSYFYDRIVDGLGMPESLTIRQIREAAIGVCENNLNFVPIASREVARKNVDEKPWFCLDLVYIYGLLSEGYGLLDDTEVTIAKKINGIETGWCLGAALNEIDILMRDTGGESVCGIEEIEELV